jgi:hypothetical protein
VSLVGGLILVHARAGDDRWRDGRPPVEPARDVETSTGDPTPESRAASIPHAVKT